MQLTKEDENHSEMIRNYTNLNDIILKKIGTSFKSLFLEIDQVSNRMKEISDLYDQLYTISYKTIDVINIFIFYFFYYYKFLIIKLLNLESNGY